MATRANRAATAANKKGGNHGRRNRSVALIHSHESVDSPANRWAFLKGRHETVARARNATASDETEPHAPGVPEGMGYTPPHPPARSERSAAAGLRQAHRSPLFRLVCTALSHHGDLPPRYTAEGEGRSPPLSWSGMPARAEEFVLLCEDLDSGAEEPPVHWLVYRIGAPVRDLPENVPQAGRIESVMGTPLQGKNSAGRLGYLPPRLSPFDSWHHFRFRLFALEASLKDLRSGMSLEEMTRAMAPHLLGVAELVARCRRSDYR